MNPAGSFTVECWANSATAAAGNHVLVQSMVQRENTANGNDRTGWCLREVGGDLQLLIGDTNATPSYYYYTAVGVVTAGVWQHIVAVWDGTGASLYVNGVKATVVLSWNLATAFPDPPPTVIYYPNRMGQVIMGDRGYEIDVGGSLDEVAIYGSALSARHSGALPERHQHHPGNAVQPARPTLNPLGYWRLNEPAWVSPPLPVT